MQLLLVFTVHFLLAETGHFALALAVALMFFQGLLPLLGMRGSAVWQLTSRPLAMGQFALVALAFGCLAGSFLADDFSVALVADNSHRALPVGYKFAATWGNHPGSLLMWLLMLSGWTLAVALLGLRAHPRWRALTLSLLGWVGTGFGLFALLASNPFERRLPLVPTNGADLNPLLQDLVMVVHPPVLYMGYVGFAVIFAMTCAHLLERWPDRDWAFVLRPWTNLAWALLTCGIALGSWWAYYELGWGGWWFWDPVENVSLMPWLAGLALMHSLSVVGARGRYLRWSVLLALLAFSLSLLGAFLVRSGLLVSVHSFASDPDRGLFLLLLLVLYTGMGLALYAWRAPARTQVLPLAVRSRELAILGNNLVLMMLLATVALGTLFPLAMEALDRGRYSVGAPYFNAVAGPLGCALGLLAVVGPLLRWGRDSGVLNRLRLPLASGLICVLLVLLWQGISLIALVASALAGAVLGTLVHSLMQSDPRPAGYWGMQIAHLGLVVTALGLGGAAGYQIERELLLGVGDRVQIAGYELQFTGLTERDGPNYQAQRAHFAVSRNNEPLTGLYPEKRRYLVGGQVMTEAAIYPGVLEDVFVALGKVQPDGRWSLRVHYKPLVRWIWAGAALMALGAVFAVLTRRRRREG